jgi:tRNA pseudouridine55 synthase
VTSGAAKGARAGGVLLVDKPEGPTSHDVVDVVRRAFSERRVGHTGTLDPFASGLLLVCVGPATRLAEFLSGTDKEYLATFRLGRRTSTHDPEGKVELESDGWRDLRPADIESALASLRGDLLQRPPTYSAKKLAGEPAHRRARRGEVVELEAVPVVVRELEMVSAELPDVALRIACSSGTYVRALARDLGDALGVGAHVSRLRRTRVGSFEVGRAVALDALADRSLVERAWLEPAEALAHLPSVVVGDAEAARLAHGQDIDAALAGIGQGDAIAVLRGGELVAVGTSRGGRLSPRKVFAGSDR